MKRFLLLLSILLPASPASAEIYKWVDKDGSVHYSDVKPEDATLEVEQFLGSSITIDEQGNVVQAGEKPATAKKSVQAAAVQKPSTPQRDTSEWTLQGVLAYGKKLWTEWVDRPAQVTKKSSAPTQPTRTASVPASDSAVISNENMGAILDQIEQERIAKEEAAAAAAEVSVEIFTTPWCGYCKKAIAYLELNKVPYEEYDVSANPTAALRQKMLGGGRGVPFAVINGEPIQGWSQQAYARALQKK